MSRKLKNILIYSAIGFFGIAAIICICCSIFIVPSSPQKINIPCEDSYTLELGEPFDLPISFDDESIELAIESADSDIAFVDGLTITGAKEGTTTIQIIAQNKSAKSIKNVKISVVQTITDLGISIPSTISIYLLDKNKNQAYNDNFFDYVEYSSDYPVNFEIENGNIISVKSGKISAKNIGQTTITFSSTTQPSVKSVHTINVLKIDPDLVINSDNEISLKVDAHTTISYSISPSYYTGTANIEIESANTNIASIEGNKINGVSVGNTKISISLNGDLVKEIDIEVSSNENAIVTPPNPEENNDDPPSDPGDENGSSIEDPQPDPPVQEESYHVELSQVQNCSVDGNIITTTASTSRVSYRIFDQDNNQLTTPYEFSLVSNTEGLSVQPALGGYIKITTSVSGSFEFVIEELNISQTFIINVN